MGTREEQTGRRSFSAQLPSRFSILSILVPSCTLEEFCTVSVRWNRVRISRERSKLSTGRRSFSVLGIDSQNNNVDNEEDTVEGLCVIKAMNNGFEMLEFF